MDSTILYLTGRPGTGKYTIAKVFARDYGYIVCDNQLINNPIFELLSYDGYSKIPDFAWDSISGIRREIFEFLKKTVGTSYVLTNNLFDDEGDASLYREVKSMAEAKGSFFVPVRLLISREEHLKRVTRAERRERWKSIDPEDALDESPLRPISHPNFFEIDVTLLTPEEAAKKISDRIKNLTK